MGDAGTRPSRRHRTAGADRRGAALCGAWRAAHRGAGRRAATVPPRRSHRCRHVTGGECRALGASQANVVLNYELPLKREGYGRRVAGLVGVPAQALLQRSQLQPGSDRLPSDGKGAGATQHQQRQRRKCMCAPHRRLRCRRCAYGRLRRERGRGAAQSCEPGGGGGGGGAASYGGVYRTRVGGAAHRPGAGARLLRLVLVTTALPQLFRKLQLRGRDSSTFRCLEAHDRTRPRPVQVQRMLARRPRAPFERSLWGSVVRPTCWADHRTPPGPSGAVGRAWRVVGRACRLRRRGGRGQPAEPPRSGVPTLSPSA